MNRAVDESRRANAERVAGTLCEYLEHFFQDILPQEHTIRVEVERGEQKPYEDGRGTECFLIFQLPDDLRIDGNLTVDNAGGNVYDVKVALAGSKEKTFSIGVPEPSTGTEEMQIYAGEVGNYLLVEMERMAGEHTLREATKASEDL